MLTPGLRRFYRHPPGTLTCKSNLFEQRSGNVVAAAAPPVVCLLPFLLLLASVFVASAEAAHGRSRACEGARNKKKGVTPGEYSPRDRCFFRCLFRKIAPLPLRPLRSKNVFVKNLRAPRGEFKGYYGGSNGVRFPPAFSTHGERSHERIPGCCTFRRCKHGYHRK